MTAFLLVAIVFLVAINGFFVAAEFALVSIRPDTLAHGNGRLDGLVARQKGQLDAYLAACQVGVTIASLALGALGEPTLANLFEPLVHSAVAANVAAAIGTVLALLAMTAIHITVGEQAPKSFAIGSPQAVARVVAYPLEAFYRALKPLVLLLNACANALVRLVGGTPASEHGHSASLSEVRSLIARLGAGGSVDSSDAKLLRGLFTLDERRASEVMTPRPRLATADESDTVAVALETALDAGASRLPVLAAGNDRRVIGLVNTRELTVSLLEGHEEDPVGSLMRPPLVTPETQPLDLLLQRMQAARVQIAVVLDEYGQLVGVVTIEDIVEEIVGEIHDEADAQDVRELSGGRLVVPGDMSLSDLSDRGIHLGEARSESIGGLVVESLDKLADRGDVVERGGHRLRVLAIDGPRILRILVVPPIATTPVAPEPKDDSGRSDT